ncbi:hypothetical protein MMC14_004847 [Varicellaria rhodocarpa]|nr:hypothetical protein [Varicellaria rhodocarpa]
MFGFNVQKDVSTTQSIAHRVLRTLLTANLPKLQPILLNRIGEAFAKDLASSSFLGDTDWKLMPTFAMARTIVVKVNSLAFVGEKLSNDEEYLQAAIQYPEDVFLTAEILQVTPNLLAPIVAALTTKNGRAINTLIRRLGPLIEERIAENSRSEGQSGKPLDCLQWIISSSPKKNPWNTEKIIQEFLALWFGSVHQMAMGFVYTLYDLCAHPEYIEPLRLEVSEQFTKRDSLENMPLLDSFLKESSRLNPSDSISVRRKVMKPFTFFDGTYIPVGNWACVPQKAMMRDPDTYKNPELFDGFRFTSQNSVKYTERGSSFTDADDSFPFWGLGHHTCPGRFFAAGILKLMVAHVLLTYDVKFADESKSRTFTWRTAIVPKSKTALLVRERK